MKRHDRIIRIVFARKQRLDPDSIKSILEILQHFLDLRNNVRIIFLVAHLNHQFNFLVLILQLFVGGHVLF